LLQSELPKTSFRIVAEAGRGGAATVYQARDDVLGRDVALKVYHLPERDREKLIREAQLAVSLAMPGVVRILDADPASGWIAMEWVQAGALSDHISRADVSWLDPAAGWFAHLAEVVARIHRRGVVHADLKPANVLMRPAGRVLVSDFGLALPAGATHLGASEGYVSPQRRAGGGATPADDVYALGKVLERSLQALPGGGDARHEPFWALARRLTAAQRPRDAGAVLALLSEPTAG
jgi:serine/threonine-protein kinase